MRRDGWKSLLLKMDVDYENEIVISESKERNKNLADYNKQLNNVFSEIYRVLKYDKYFSLMFNSLDDKTWSNVISELHTLNFQLHKIETLGYSANSVIQDTRENGLKTDFILTFIKKNNYLNYPLEIITLKEEDVREQIDKLKTTDTGNDLPPYKILNHFFKYYLNQNKFFKISEIINIINKKTNNKN